MSQKRPELAVGGRRGSYARANSSRQVNGFFWEHRPAGLIIGVLIDETPRSVNISEPHSPPPHHPSSPLQVPPALAKVFFCEELPICGSVREDLPVSRACLPAGWQVGRCHGPCVGQTLEAMSLEMEPPGGTGSDLHFCSEEHDLNPSYHPVAGIQVMCFAIDKQETLFSVFVFVFFVKRLFLNDFLMPLGEGGGGGSVTVGCYGDRKVGGIVHVTELTSPTPVSMVTRPQPRACLTDSSQTVFHINSVNGNLVWVEERKSLCKHYLLSAQYRFFFSICNQTVCVCFHPCRFTGTRDQNQGAAADKWVCNPLQVPSSPRFGCH